MNNINKKTFSTLPVRVVLALLLVGCGSSRVSREHLPSPKEFQTDPYGRWLIIDYRDEAKPDLISSIEGEFIALQDSVVYLHRGEKGVVPVMIGNIQKAEIGVFRNQSGKVLIWAFIGTLSTLSHGFFLIISAPLWILTGTFAVIGASHEGYYSQNNPDIKWWTDMSCYARFPQGLPRGVDVNTLQLKKEKKE